jgi:thioredoxin 1
MNMKYVTIIVLMLGMSAYALWPEQEELEAKAFARELEACRDKVLIDLRSGSDFSAGHIAGAMNIDWGRRNFSRRAAGLDTAATLFIYCGDGKRSALAFDYLRSHGFVSVRVLKDGLASWSRERYTITPSELVPPAELTLKEFSRMLDLEHLVIVSFYLPDDRNSRLLEPVLDELAIAWRGKVKILRIDIDNYKYLATEMGIESVPVLQFYENGNLCTTIEGLNSRDAIETEFNLVEYVANASGSSKEKRPA